MGVALQDQRQAAPFWLGTAAQRQPLHKPASVPLMRVVFCSTVTIQSLHGMPPVPLPDCRQCPRSHSMNARDQYIAAHKSGWKNPEACCAMVGHAQDVASPVFGALPVAAIDTGLVVRVIEPLWTKKPETATRLRGRIEINSGLVAGAWISRPEKIRRGGRAISITCFLRGIRCRRSSITPRCPTVRSAAS